jgi:hypothetical protein
VIAQSSDLLPNLGAYLMMEDLLVEQKKSNNVIVTSPNTPETSGSRGIYRPITVPGYLMVTASKLKLAKFLEIHPLYRQTV